MTWLLVRLRQASKVVGRFGSSFHGHLGPIESPTPILFVTAENLSSHVWDKQVQSLRYSGYNCVVFSPDTAINSCVDDVANSLYATIEHHKLTPPIMISHSFSTLVCQRYLESYPALGLIMINPIPPNPIRVINKIKNSVLYKSDAVQRFHFLKAHFQLSMPDNQCKNLVKNCGENGYGYESESRKFPPYVENLIKDDKGNVHNFINVESFACPILAVTTSGDNHLLGKEDIDDMKSFYDLMDDGYRHLSSCESRAPMIESFTEINETVTEFIDGVA